MPVVDITDEAQLADSSLNSSLNSLDDRLPLMVNLSGQYTLESSGTERYDVYIDRAAAYDKAQQLAKRTSRHAVRSPTCPNQFFSPRSKQVLAWSMDSAGCTL